MKFSKYVFVHRRGVENEAKGCAIVDSLKLSLGQAVDRMAANGMEDVRAQMFCHSPQRTGLDGFYYRRMLLGDKVVQCSALKSQS